MNQNSNFISNRLIHFKHWTRKSFAVFNSLHKIIKISSLSIALTATALPGKVAAQSDTTEQVSIQKELEEVEIVEQEILQVFEVPSQLIAVVGRQQLQNAPIETVQDVLNSISQIDLRQRGNNDVQADISIRGGTFDQVLVMLNGVNITNPQTGHHNLDIPISFDQIERVEILNGAGAQSYGANAYSGVVNIITRTSSNNNVRVHLKAGDFGLYGLDASANLVHKNQRHFLALNYNASDGYTANTDYQKASFYYSGRAILKSSFFDWQLSAMDKSFGAHSFYTAKYPNQLEATKSALASLRYQSYGKLSTKSHIYWNMHTDRFELFRAMEDAPSWYARHNYHLTQVAGGNSRLLFNSGFGKTTLGMDLRYEHIASNVLGNVTSDTIAAWFDPDGFYTRADERFNTSLFAEHELSFYRLKVLASLMANMNTAYPGQLNWYPGLDVNYRLTNSWHLKTSVNRSLRLPTFTDLYYQGPANTGNPDLEPEEAWNLDFGITYSRGITRFSLSSFNSFGSNNIDWVRKADTLKWQPMNLTRVETYGLDFSAAFDLGKLHSGNFFIRRLSLQYTFITKNADAGSYESHYVMDYLRHKLVVGLYHRLWKDFYAGWNLRTQERNGNYLQWDPATGSDISVPYGHYTLVDTRIYWKCRAWMIYVDVKNLFDVTYFDYGNVVQPGRWFSAGVKWNVELRVKDDRKTLLE